MLVMLSAFFLPFYNGLKSKGLSLLPCFTLCKYFSTFSAGSIWVVPHCHPKAKLYAMQSEIRKSSGLNKKKKKRKQKKQKRSIFLIESLENNLIKWNNIFYTILLYMRTSKNIIIIIIIVVYNFYICCIYNYYFNT